MQLFKQTFYIYQKMSTYEFSNWSSISVAKITHQQGNIWHNHSVVEAEVV